MISRLSSRAKSRDLLLGNTPSSVRLSVEKAGEKGIYAVDPLQQSELDKEHRCQLWQSQ